MAKSDVNEVWVAQSSLWEVPSESPGPRWSPSPLRNPTGSPGFLAWRWETFFAKSMVLPHGSDFSVQSSPQLLAFLSNVYLSALFTLEEGISGFALLGNSFLYFLPFHR